MRLSEMRLGGCTGELVCGNQIVTVSAELGALTVVLLDSSLTPGGVGWSCPSQTFRATLWMYTSS